MKPTAFIAPTVAAALLLAGIAAAAPVTGAGPTAAPSRQEAIALHASITAGITPGTSAPVRLTASNAGSSPITIRTVHLLDVSADNAHPNCVTDDFTMTDVQQEASIPGGARDYGLASGTLTFKNTDVNQDGCKAATLTLILSSTHV
jgi:hypothetical protein